MKKLILILSLALSGCFYQTVNNTEIEVAINKCGSSATIVKIDSASLGGAYIYCKDGSSFYLVNGKLR